MDELRKLALQAVAWTSRFAPGLMSRGRAGQ
jgi:hypothetical protein